MNKNGLTAQTADQSLRNLATDLHEIYSLLNELSLRLEGGGIVTVRDVEPTVSTAVPRLRSAVATLYAAAKNQDKYGDKPAGAAKLSQNPLLI